MRITEDVAEAVREAGIAEGMVLVSAMHITAAVWINDDEPGIQADALEWLDKLAPPSWQEPANEVARELLPDPGDYRHHRGGGEDNGDAHLKNLLVHHQVIVPVTDGRARPRAVAADLLLRVRRPALEAARDQGDGGVGVEASRVFAPGCSKARSRSSPVAEPTSARPPRRSLLRCGASVVIAGRREEVLERGRRGDSASAARGRRETSASRRARSGSCATRSSAMAGSTSCSTTRAASTSSRPRASRRRAGGQSSA